MVKKDKTEAVKSVKETKKVLSAKKSTVMKTTKKTVVREDEVKKVRKNKNKLGKTKFRFDLSSYIYKVVKSIAPE